MTLDQMLGRLRRELNRPEDDDLYDEPECVEALRDAERHGLRLLSDHRLYGPVITTGLALSTDGGVTYDMGDSVYWLQVWTPPGVGNGYMLHPKEQYVERPGYQLEGNRIRMLPTTNWTPGLYYEAVKATPLTGEPDAAGVAQASRLPEIMHEWQVLDAASKLATKPGSLIDWRLLESRAAKEFAGDAQNPFDSGLLGTLKRQNAHYGMSAQEDDPRYWWRGMPG